IVYTNNTNAGTASAKAIFAATSNHQGSFDSKSFTIAKSPTTTSVSCRSPVVYSGEAQTPCSGMVTGAGLEMPVTPTYMNNTNGGPATAGYEYEGDASYAPSHDSKQFQITPAQTLTMLTCPSSSVTYTGAAQ